MASGYLPSGTQGIKLSHNNQRVVEDTEARPQTTEENLGILTLPVGNSYKGQVMAVFELRKRKVPAGRLKRAGPLGQRRSVPSLSKSCMTAQQAHSQSFCDFFKKIKLLINSLKAVHFLAAWHQDKSAHLAFLKAGKHL